METMDLKPFLRDMFPQHTDQTIDFVINVVEEQNPEDDPDEKMENIVNMLSEQAHDIITQERLVESENGNYSGYDRALNRNYDQLVHIFPDADPDFLWKYCQSRKFNFDLDDAIDHLTTEGYDKFVQDPLVIWERLKETLPGADPSYLKTEADKLALLDSQKLEQFVSDAIENNDYPTMQDYLKHKEENDTLNMYRDSHFDPDAFLELFPDPEKTFRHPERVSPLSGAHEDDIIFAKVFLYNNYPFIRKRHIDLVFKRKWDRLIECCDQLDVVRKGLKTKRGIEDEPQISNLALLQETAYLKHRRLIKRFIKYKDESYRQCKEEARKLNVLETCLVCYEDELIPEECFVCGKGCVFCKDCVRKGVETRIGDGHTTFPCFQDCGSEFNLNQLQMALPKKSFERLVLKVQSEEIRRANVEGLETCPFCDFVSIPAENSTLFKCENPDCGVESCRQCRHESHVPVRCSEIEYDEDVKRRTYIENKMTEAITRTCYKCQKKFVKLSGCNKMTCSCGAKMCYLCCQPIDDYSHFAAGARCALFTNDNVVNLTRVKETAERAKQELGDVDIKFDPTVGIEQFF